MFWTVKTPFLIICILILDLLLIGDIINNNKTEVLGVSISRNSEKIQKKIIIKKPEIKKVAVVTKKVTPSPSKEPSITSTPTKTSDSVNTSPSPTSMIVPADKKNESETTDLLQQINNFRAGKGLSPLSANSETCFFANLRSQEIISNFNHDGFTNRINTKTLPYPSYTSVAENIAMNPDSGKVIQGWIDSPGHNANMSKDVPYGCVVGNGNYYVFEAWKP